jgi:hypothetical protein
MTWRRWLNPFYIFDLVGRDGRPSFTKLLGIASFVLGWVLVFTVVQVLDLWATIFLMLLFGVPYGMRGYRLFVESRAAGLTGAASDAARGQPEVERARADILQRRAIGAADGVEPSS